MQAQYEEAIQYCKQTNFIAESIEYTQGLADFYANLGGTFIKLKRWEEAEENRMKAIDVYRSTVPSVAGINLGLLAWVKGTQPVNQKE